MSWEALAGFRVAVLPDLRVRLVEEAQGTDETVTLDAWLDSAAETFYVTLAGRVRARGVQRPLQEVEMMRRHLRRSQGRRAC